MQFIRDACIMIKNAKQPTLNLTIHLTSPVVREEAEKQVTGGTLTFVRDETTHKLQSPSRQEIQKNWTKRERERLDIVYWAFNGARGCCVTQTCFEGLFISS